MKTYIVRIYRLERDQPLSLVGVVEEVGVKGRKGFTNYDELWGILKSPTMLPPSSPEGGGRAEGLSQGKNSE